MGDTWTDRLSQYLDGDLSDRDRRNLETHLAQCRECESTLSELRSVVERARALEPAPPASDLWPAIAARLEPRSRKAAASPGPWPWWRFTLTVPQAAAASMALVVLSGAAVWWATGRAPRVAAPGAPPRIAARIAAGTAVGERSRRSETDVAPPSGAVAAFDPRYDATIAELQRILAHERDRLDTTTVRVVEQNLAIIDRAVAEARRAVEADPGNFYLRNHLAQTMKRKVELLRLATVIASANG